MTDRDDAGPVLTSIDDHGVAVVTLNRPDRMNAWTREMSDLLSDSMEKLDSEDRVRVIVVTGAGRAFCAGVDIDTFVSPDPARPPWRPWTERTVPSQISKPVVAAINGAAVGIGLSYAALCDVRFVASDAKLGFVFNRRGMAPEAGVHATLSRIVGHGTATELLLSGRIFMGSEAAALGFASAALPTDGVLSHAVAWATDVAVNCSPASVGATKYLMSGARRSEDVRAISIEDGLTRTFSAAADSKEGMRAFRERRAPSWRSSHADGVAVAAELAGRSTGGLSTLSPISMVANDVTPTDQERAGESGDRRPGSS